MAPFDLSVQSFTAPTLPPQPSGLTAADIRSPLMSSVLSPTSPLKIRISLPHARDNNDPLYPATRLQLSYTYPGTGDVFGPNFITPRDLVVVDASANLYEFEMASGEIPRGKVNHGMTSTAEVIVYAWKGEKLLGKWVVGQIEGLGIEGMKSNELSMSRAEARRVFREALT